MAAVGALALPGAALAANSSVTVSARADLDLNLGPNLALMVNGVEVAHVEVRATAFQGYVFSVPYIPVGAKVDVFYTNDTSVRNLYVQSLTIDGVTTASTAAGVIYDTGAGAAAFDGLNTRAGITTMYWGGALRFIAPAKTGEPPITTPGPGVFIDGSALGNDSNPGTLQKPWKTLAPANNARLASGAGVYLRCGYTYRGTLTLTNVHLQNGSIVAGYGSCSASSKAVISGADDFSGGWVKSGNVWSRRVPTTTAKITQMFVDGVRQRTAQWPHSGGIGHEYAISSATSLNSRSAMLLPAADKAALGSRDLVGATLIVRTSAYTVDQTTVGSFNTSSGQLNIATPTQYVIPGGAGYILADKYWMLGAPGEFFHDKQNGVIYVYPSAGASQANLNASSVEGTVRSSALNMSLRSGLVVKNIGAVKTSIVGMMLSNTPNAVVDNVDGSDNIQFGFRMDRVSPGGKITNSSFRRNGYSAVNFDGVANVTLSNNVISDTGVYAYSGPSKEAVNVGPGGIVDRNYISRSGYIGIRFSGMGGTKITNNLVEDSCLRLSDGAAIYSWNGANTTFTQSSVVENNVVSRSMGNKDGLAGSPSPAAGIYADDLSNRMIIRGNTVSNAQMGIYLHDASYITVDSNKVWLSTMGAFWINMDHVDRNTAVGNVYSNNQFNVVNVMSGTYPAKPTMGSAARTIWVWNKLTGSGSLKDGTNNFANNQTLLLNGSTQPVGYFHGKDGDFTSTADNWVTRAPGDKRANASMTYLGYVGTTVAKTSDWAAVAYATPTASTVVTCATLGWSAGCSARDANGAAIGLPATLPAGTSKLFLRMDTTARVQ